MEYNLAIFHRKGKCQQNRCLLPPVSAVHRLELGEKAELILGFPASRNIPPAVVDLLLLILFRCDAAKAKEVYEADKVYKATKAFLEI